MQKAPGMSFSSRYSARGGPKPSEPQNQRGERKIDSKPERRCMRRYAFRSWCCKTGRAITAMTLRIRESKRDARNLRFVLAAICVAASMRVALTKGAIRKSLQPRDVAKKTLDLCTWRVPQYSRNKKETQSESLGICRRPGGYLGRRRRPKVSVRSSKCWSKAFWSGGADVHDLGGTQKTLFRNASGWSFFQKSRSLRTVLCLIERFAQLRGCALPWGPKTLQVGVRTSYQGTNLYSACQDGLRFEGSHVRGAPVEIHRLPRNRLGSTSRSP